MAKPLTALLTAVRIVSLVWVCILALFVGGFFIGSCRTTTTMWRFSMRSQAYYNQVTEACDQLIAQVGSARSEIRGEKLQSLPPVLRDLRPAHVLVETNLVLIRIGGGRTGQVIVWKQNEGFGSWWELTVSTPETAKGRTVFSKEKPTIASSPSPVDTRFLLAPRSVQPSASSSQR